MVNILVGSSLWGRFSLVGPPDSLRDLKFTGQWDQIALQRVNYYPNADRSAFYVDVEQGWIGKPKLEMPDEFWKGTGYSEALRPEKRK